MNVQLKKVISKVVPINIDIIECGFITDINFDHNKSLYLSVERIRHYIFNSKNGTYFINVGMIAQPYPTINKISEYDGKSIDGIRVTFHEDEIE